MSLKDKALEFLAAHGLSESEIAVVTDGPFLAQPWWEWQEFLVDAAKENALAQVSDNLRIWYGGRSVVIRWNARVQEFQFEALPGAPKPPASRLRGR